MTSPLTPRNPNGTFARHRPLGYRKKTCLGCGRYLYLGQFYKFAVSKNHPDGYDCRCQDCRRKEKREAYARNRKIPDGIRLSNGRAVEKNGSSSRLYWGEQKIADFKRLFPFNTNESVAIDMECSVRTVVRRARELGLKKDPHWLANVWNRNRKKANRLISILGPQNDLTNFIEAGKSYRFSSENHPTKHETPEQASARMKKAWQTRKMKKQ